MKPKNIITPEQAASVFGQAVREKALAVVTTQDEDDWKTFKCRFLECDASRRYFVLDHLPIHENCPPELLPGQFVGVSFRHRSRKILFATVVEARGRFVLDDQTAINAVRYRWPESLTELQRRAYYRTPIPAGEALTARIWSGGLTARTAAQDAPTQVWTGRLLDLSCGGAQVALTEASPPPWSENATLGVELNLSDGKPPLLLNAYYRGAREGVGSESRSIAIQFIGLELSVDGRLVLQHLARCVQRFNNLTQPHNYRGNTARYN